MIIHKNIKQYIIFINIVKKKNQQIVLNIHINKLLMKISQEMLYIYQKYLNILKIIFMIL
jgi:hypothetical protein